MINQSEVNFLERGWHDDVVCFVLIIGNVIEISFAQREPGLLTLAVVQADGAAAQSCKGVRAHLFDELSCRVK